MFVHTYDEMGCSVNYYNEICRCTHKDIHLLGSEWLNSNGCFHGTAM